MPALPKTPQMSPAGLRYNPLAERRGEPGRTVAEGCIEASGSLRQRQGGTEEAWQAARPEQAREAPDLPPW